MSAGEFEAAARGWEARAAESTDRRGALLLRAGEAWLAANRPGRAERAFERIDIGTLSGDERIRLDLAQAELAMARGRLANAGWLLASTADRLPRHLAARHAELEARLQTLQSQPIRGALAALEEALDEPDFSGETALALLLEFPLADLEGAAKEAIGRTELLPWLDLVVSARENLLDDAGLEAGLAAWQDRWPRIDYPADEALAWVAAWRQTRPLPGRIAVLLPAPDTPLSEPGKALRNGLLAGWLELPPDRRPELRFEYLDDDPEAVLGAWFDARENGVDHLIGPLARHHVDALLELPDAGLLPSLLLNLPRERDLLTTVGGEIAALAMPPEHEAELAAIHALSAGHERAIVLSQYSDWGERVAEAFSETFTLGGGRIVASRIYDPALPDHSTLLRELLHIERSETRTGELARTLGMAVESVPARRTDVDAIFLGARAEDGRAIRPQLAFFDAGELALLATSHIVEGAPRPDRDRDLEGVIVPLSPWFIDDTPAGAKRLRARRLYDNLGNATLSRLHALGRDAIALLPWLEMMRADRQLRLPGMMGTFSLPDDRFVERELPIVELRGGRARPVEMHE